MKRSLLSSNVMFVEMYSASGIYFRLDVLFFCLVYLYFYCDIKSKLRRFGRRDQSARMMAHRETASYSSHSEPKKDELQLESLID